LTVISPSIVPGIVLFGMGLVNMGWHFFIFFYGGFNTGPNAFNFDTWLGAGYNTLILSSWIMKGLQFVAWPLTFISEEFAWIYLVACALNVAVDWSVSVAGVSFWMVSIGVDYVKLEKDFLVAFLGELFIWAATVGVDALFIRGVVDWYYFGVLG
jgi:hypothetical protein